MATSIRVSPALRLMAVVVTAVLCSSAASARDMEQYFAGKTITVVVGSTAGGGADFTARLFTKFATKHFPGHPNFIIQNVPGGGQLKGLQQGMRAKPDGLTVASLHPRWAVRSILGDDLSPFDIRTAKIAGAPAAIQQNELICTDSKLHKSWDSVLKAKEPITLGGIESGARATIGASLLELIGAPVKMVLGYSGSSEVYAAFDRGEVTAVSCTEINVPRLYPEWLTQKRLTPLFWWGAPPNPAYVERIGSPNKPIQLFDLPGVKMTDEAKKALQASHDMFLFTRALVMPPEVPDDIHQAWKAAFRATIEDPELVALAKNDGLDVGWAAAESFQETITMASQLSPSGLELFRKLIGDMQ
jgi:tripartite-type tricarboxylate transporter receptor subunit TctC